MRILPFAILLTIVVPISFWLSLPVMEAEVASGSGYVDIEAPVEVEVEKSIIIEVVKEIEVERIIEIPIEGPVSQPIQYRHFNSVAEAQEWVDSNKFLIGKWGCGNYSEEWQRRALKDGFIISEWLIERNAIFGAYVTDAKCPHAGGQLKIGDKYYYLETWPYCDYYGKIIYVVSEKK